MGVHIAVDGGDVFFGGDSVGGEGGGGGCLYTLDICVFFCAFCLIGCWGALFFVGGRFCWRGRGRGWVLVDKGCVVPSFVVFV